MITSIPIWKKAPFIRFVLPLTAGIILQWYLQFSLSQIIVAALSFSIAHIAFRFFPLVIRFKFQILQGFLINLILIVLGLFITYLKDIRHQQNWFGNLYSDSNYLVVTINEPLLEKANSFKAEALVDGIIQKDSIKNCLGKLLLYFSKDKDFAGSSQLNYGDKILINKNLQLIKNSGNPGAFNYQRYSAFHQIFHNIFLKKDDWVLLKDKNINPFQQFLFRTRQNILNILQQSIPGHNDELSIAEALLIGYTQDLDKDLVQAYSNTGVVHIIAISGLHLGLIYFMLVWIFNKIPFVKRSRIIKAVFILSCLWLFSLLTGGSASVLRSAVMFSFIVIGENFFKKSSIYSSLAASAFLLLCYNPYYLWDVGFQLSYLAVLSIVIFQKPIYHLLYIKNKWINKVWELAAVSLAAQILTFPICLYYFHQFPNTFLFTNLLLVPLSSLILFVEIFLIAFSWISLVSLYIGKLTWWLIWVMNKIILWFNDLPYSVWDRISVSVTATIILYSFIFCIGFWLLNKNKTAFKLSLFTLFAFMLLTAWSKWEIANQKRLIVYNVPKHKAIDFVDGNDYTFIGDSILLIDGMMQNFHLKPGRIAFQLNKKVDHLSALSKTNHFFKFNNKNILLIDSLVVFEPLSKKIKLDYIIIFKNPRLTISNLAQTFDCTKFIFDSSNSLWRIEKWEKDCKQLHIDFHSIPEQGAFIMNI